MAADEDHILHRLFERLGNIDAKLESGGRRHIEFAQTLAEQDDKLDILNDRVGKVEGLAARISIIEPTLWELEGKRREAVGVKKFFGGVMTRGRAAVGIVGGSVGATLTAFVAWLVHQFGSGPPPH